MTAADLAQALGGRRVTRGWMARCPAHDDRKPSLSIAEGDDRSVVVKCFAGCSQDAVIAALRERGLWSSGATTKGDARKRERPKRSKGQEGGGGLHLRRTGLNR